MHICSKKGLTSIVAATLLIIVAVLSVVWFNLFLSKYNSGLFVKVEDTGTNDYRMENLVDGFLYIFSEGNYSVEDIKVNDVSCNLSLLLVPGVNEIDLRDCIGKFGDEVSEIVVLSNSSVESKSFYVKNYNDLVRFANSAYFARVFSGTNYSRGLSVVTTPGYIYVGGYTDPNVSGLTDGYIVKLDNLGNLVFNVTVGFPTQSEYVKYLEVVSDGIVFTGATYSTNYSVFTGKIDFNGNLLWNKTYGNSSLEEGDTILIDGANNIIVLGTTFTNTAGYKDVLFLKYSQDGTLLANKTLGTTANEWGEDIISLSDGNFLVASDQDKYDGTYYNYFVMKVNSSSGAIIWNNSYVTPGNDHIRKLYELSNGDILLIGYSDFDPAKKNDYWVIRINATGGVIWNKSFGSIGDEIIKYGVLPVSSSEIFAPGFTTSYGAGLEDAWVLKFDTNGNSYWNVSYGGLLDDRFYDVAITSDGYLVFTGYTDSFGDGVENLWIVKTSMAGETCDYHLTGECNRT